MCACSQNTNGRVITSAQLQAADEARARVLLAAQEAQARIDQAAALANAGAQQ